MILNPGIIALLLVSFFVVVFAGYAAFTGFRIIQCWDLESGSSIQLNLERKTYLVSTIFGYVSAFQLLSLFLFAYTVDHIHTLFIGAMCAAGALNANGYGNPVLVLKTLNVFLCGVWLLVNYTDNRAEDYPLIAFKYKFLILITGLLFVESFMQFAYFEGLRPDIITSCCGTLFGEETEGLGGHMASVPPRTIQIIFFLSLGLTLRVGIHLLLTGRGAILFAGLAAGSFILSIVSIISFISPYFYELPTHHCPFCLLQRDYDYIGYALYISLLPAGIFGAGIGVLERFSTPASLKGVIPVLQKRLCILSMSAYLVFAAISVYPMISSDFVLESHLLIPEDVPGGTYMEVRA
ncbi:MAG: hypothetical protein U5R49_15490 [Deltaproteobacteria bacterium]|nr:hypothetical protein [Deltaproteobacteria bacterium]